MICCREGCDLDARWAPKLCVPAAGYAIERHEPLQALVGLALCTYHIADLKPADLLGGPIGADDAGGERLRQVFRVMAGKVPPDFERAWIARVSVNSPEFRTLQQSGRGAVH